MSVRDTGAAVAVIGAGPAGIAAAVYAAESGKRVVLVDEGLEPGGQIWRHRAGAAPPAAARRWLDRLADSGATVVCGASVIDLRAAAAGFTFEAEQGTTVHRVRAGRVVLATGARERFLPFPGWTLPGVVGVGGAQALLKAGTSFAGKRVVVGGTGPLLLPVAASLARAGARLALVAEQASGSAVARFAAGLWRRPALLWQAARYRAAFAGTRYRPGTWVTRAAGDGTLREVTLTDGRATRTVPCDVLCTGYGLVPSTELARLVGCDVAGGIVLVDEQQRTSVPGVYCAGEPTGIGGVERSLIEGRIAGLAAGGREHDAAGLVRARGQLRTAAHAMEQTFALRTELRGLAAAETVVCRCEDVPFGAIRATWSARQAKLYTRAGMGPCQGRVCGAALEFIFGWSPDTVRPPIAPVLLSTLLAGIAPAAPPEQGGS